MYSSLHLAGTPCAARGRAETVDQRVSARLSHTAGSNVTAAHLLHTCDATITLCSEPRCARCTMTFVRISAINVPHSLRTSLCMATTAGTRSLHCIAPENENENKNNDVIKEDRAGVNAKGILRSKPIVTDWTRSASSPPALRAHQSHGPTYHAGGRAGGRAGGHAPCCACTDHHAHRYHTTL